MHTATNDSRDKRERNEDCADVQIESRYPVNTSQAIGQESIKEEATESFTDNRWTREAFREKRLLERAEYNAERISGIRCQLGNSGEIEERKRNRGKERGAR